MFPDSISLPGGSLRYKGTFNGHGYYQSSGKYTQPDARAAAANAGGHLITITSAAENSFVVSNLNQTNNYAWIGLVNTGRVGSFAWVTGEALSYTNWLPGQPNNLYGMNNPDSTIYEPYVQINGWEDNTNRWNDIGNRNSENSVFLAEYDSSVLVYRKYAGPANGDSLAAGVYTVCYEILNRVTNRRDSCCFNITVVCGKSLSEFEITSAYRHSAAAENGAFRVVAYPTPSNSNFSVRITSNNVKEKIRLQVVDVMGRVVESQHNIAPNTTLLLGSAYKTGVYFTRITQGDKVSVIKLVKQ
jgi:hypothetical protein